MAKKSKKDSKYWEKRIAKNFWIAYNNFEDRNRGLLELYQIASKNIKDELYELAEKHSKDGTLSRTEMYRENHLKILEDKYVKIAEELGEELEKETVSNMQTAYKETYEITMESLSVPEFALPNKKLMDAVLQEPWKGGNFSKRLWGEKEKPGQMQKLVVALDSVLTYGLQTGKTVTQMAVELNNVMNKGFNASIALVRTEAIHYMNNAALQGYKDAGIKYVQIWTAPDERRCDRCGSYHGKIYPIDKCPILPFHTNCRCTIIPVTDEQQIADYERQYGSDESDIGQKIANVLTGVNKQKKVFTSDLRNIVNKDIRILLEQSFNRTTIKRAEGKKSKYSPSEKTVHLAKSADVSTIAHELFHEIDDTYGLIENGLLKESVHVDYRRLQNLSKGYGSSIEEMLLSRFPEAFYKNDQGKILAYEEYRGISDIIHGCSNGEIHLGFGHNKTGYWEKEYALQRETFAQYGRMSYNNKKAMNLFKELFPETEAEISGTIGRMLK